MMSKRKLILKSYSDRKVTKTILESRAAARLSFFDNSLTERPAMTLEDMRITGVVFSERTVAVLMEVPGLDFMSVEWVAWFGMGQRIEIEIGAL